MHPIANGLLFGLVFIFSLGPAFFSLIQTSIQNGFRAAILLAIGVSLSDIFFVSLASLGISNLLEDPDIRFWMGTVGTIILIAYGVYSWGKKPRIYYNQPLEAGRFGRVKYLAKGFLLNALNPFIVVFWIGMISVVTARFEYGAENQILFFVGVLVTILSTDLLKAFVAHRLKYMITPRIILRLNRTVAIILILFGLRIIYFLIDNYWINGNLH